MTAFSADRLPGSAEDPDHELVDRLIDLHPPRDADVARRMDDVRSAMKLLAHLVVDVVPSSPDRTVALRSIHRACQDAIGAIACNQHLIPEER